ncbi:unnamed protein product [Lathyrus oleraceus]
MITLSPGSVQIISEALRAASVASATTTNVSLLKSRKYPSKSISLLDQLIYWKSCNNSTLFCFDRVMTKMDTCLFQSQASDQFSWFLNSLLTSLCST